MPLILPPEAVDTWLIGTPDQAKALLVPYPSELMRAHRVSNKPENDNPELMARLSWKPNSRRCSSTSLSILAAAQTREISGFQSARSPPAPRRELAGPTRFPIVRWSADFRPPRPPIVRG